MLKGGCDGSRSRISSRRYERSECRRVEGTRRHGAMLTVRGTDGRRAVLRFLGRQWPPEFLREPLRAVRRARGSGHPGESPSAAAKRSREKRERFKELRMLKITMKIEAGLMTFALEGKLAGPWVKELELCWRSAASTQRIYPVRVDLSSVTFIDAAGKDLIGRMYREGAKLLAAGCLKKCNVEGVVQYEEKKDEGWAETQQREREETQRTAEFTDGQRS